MSYKALDLPDQVRGDTWKFTFVFKDTNNVAIDITGLQYWFTVKESRDDTDAIAGVQVGPFVAEAADALLGQLDLTISPLQTENLDPKTYYYDLQEVTVSNEVSTLLLGRVKVKQDITLNATYGGTTTQSTSSTGTALYIGETTTAGAQEIFIDQIVDRRLSVQLNGTLAFDAIVTGKDTVTNESCAFQLNGALENDAGTVIIIGSVGKFILGKENATFDANIVADDTNNALALQVTPASTNTTKWRARVDYVEIS
jgi:hypothetical protein